MNNPLLLAALGLTLGVGPALADTTQTPVLDVADARWQIVNDNVMGGKSRGALRIADGDLVFSGETSLRNNGGFSWVRTARQPRDLGQFEGLALRVRGDGRDYKLTVETTARHWGMPVTYWASFGTTRDRWTTVKIPFKSLIPTFHGRKLRGPKLDPSKTRAIGVIIYDKKAGPFKVEVETVSGYRKAQGKDLVETAVSAGSFKTLVAAVKAAGLVGLLQSKGPFTVLAPTDAAFAKLPKGTVASLLKPENKPKLVAILKHHVIAGRVMALDALKAGSAKSAYGELLTFRLDKGRLQAGAANVIVNDISTTNGVIHVIDRVLMPSKLPESLPVRLNAAQAVETIKGAISRGVKLYNAGDAKGCGAVYQAAAAQVLKAEGLPTLSAKVLDLTLRHAPKIRSAEERAWVLRSALDLALTQLQGNSEAARD